MKIFELNSNECNMVDGAAVYCCSAYFNRSDGWITVGKFYDQYEYGVYVNGYQICNRNFNNTCRCSTIQPHELCF